MQKALNKQTFTRRINSMLNADFKRMMVSPFFYIIVGVSFAVPILILVMTNMMAGTTTVNPQTGIPSEPMQTFSYVWQIFGSISGDSSSSAGMTMDLVSMCNINMLYFACAVLVCIFISEDFKSGYVKNLFTVRVKKAEYVFSKTVVCFLGSAIMFIAFFIGAIIGGGVGGVPFTMEGFNVGNIIFCMLSKICLIPVFVSIFTLASVIAKAKTWLSTCISLGVGMLLFMMIPSLTPLNAPLIHVVLCIAGSALFAIGLGSISNAVLNKTALV